MKKTLLCHTSEDKHIADTHHLMIASHHTPAYWLAICCLLLILVIYSVQAAGQEVVFENSFEFSSVPIDPNWQLLYGYESGGITSDQEGVIDVTTDGAGNVYSLVDRRYQTDPTDRHLLLTVDSAGTLTNALLLDFSGSVEPERLIRTYDGNFLIVVEGNEVIKFDPAGQLIWARTLKRDPYAFGGMKIRAVKDDSTGNIYFAGSFSPSEPDLFDDRGFVAKLDSSGNGLWMRSWDLHDSFFEGLGLTVSDNGNTYATDRVKGLDFVTRRMVFGFAPNGTAIGQASLIRDTSNGPEAAATTITPIAEGSGVTIIGFRNVAPDGDEATLVYHTTFDSSLQLTANTGTRLESQGNLFPIFRATTASRSADGSIRLGVGNEDDYGVVALRAGAASAFKLERADGTSPYIDDEDYQVQVVSGPNNELYIGGTSEQPGTVQLAPVISAVASVPLRIEDPGYTINVETLTLLQEATTFTVANDTLGVINEPQDGDKDALFLRTNL